MSGDKQSLEIKAGEEVDNPPSTVLPLAKENFELKELQKGITILEYVQPNAILIESINQVDVDENKAIEPYTINRSKGWFFLPSNHVNLCEKHGYMFTLFELLFQKLGYTPIVLSKDSSVKFVEEPKTRLFLQGWGSSLVTAKIPEFPKSKSRWNKGIISFMFDRFSNKKGIDNGLFKWNGTKSTIHQVLGNSPDKSYPTEFKVMSLLVWLARNHRLDEFEIGTWLKSKEQICHEKGISIIHKGDILLDEEQQIVDLYIHTFGIRFDLFIEEKQIDSIEKIKYIQNQVKGLQDQLTKYKQTVKKITEERLRSVYSQKGLKKKDKSKPVRELVSTMDINSFIKDFNPTLFLPLFGGKIVTLFGSLTERETLNLFWSETQSSLQKLQDSGVAIEVVNLMENCVSKYLRHIESEFFE